MRSVKIKLLRIIFKARKADTLFTLPPPLSHLTAITYKMTGTEEMVSRKHNFLEFISKSGTLQLAECLVGFVAVFRLR